MPNREYPAVTPESFISPLASAEVFYFVSAHTIYPYYHAVTAEQNTYYQRITAPNGQTFENEYKYSTNGSTSGQDIGINLTLQPGTYIVYYSFTYFSTGPLGNAQEHTNTATYTFVVVDNLLPLKKWTATDVINRLLDLAETLRKGERPRMRLQGINEDGSIQTGSQADKFNQILSPEFSFTKQTLRENLQEVGRVVHGEPRLSVQKDGSGTYYYEVSYDLYGQGKPWKQAHRAYVKKDVTQNINTYSSSLDTHAENLINKQGNYSGVIVEPYAGGAKTVRTEQMYVQITEQNMIIPTQFPIYSIEAVELVGMYVPASGESYYTVTDITKYIFESSVYTSRLSSYDTEYPYSKAFGLMYTQGERNITALSFKPEHPISSIFENYAILNIIRAAKNDANYTIEGSQGSGANYTEGQYPRLSFRVTYTPIYQSRVRQTKTDYQNYKRPAAMIYNQQANIIESRAYGENLKGAIARFGNMEKSYTYRLSRLSQIPQKGMLFDAEYTISGIYVELLPGIINCTIALTKNFNRISQYIGISSVKRFSQVSQTMALERNTLWGEYVVIGDEVAADTDCFIGDNLMASIAATFTQTGDYPKLTNVTAWGLSGEENPLPTVCLPVIASSFGNSIAFSWEYADNYSAGAISQYQEGGTSESNKVTGYFQNDYRYTDYYGKMYYYNFDISPAGEVPEPGIAGANRFSQIVLALPGTDTTPTTSSGYFSTIGQAPIILRKDNREKLQCNVQVDFVTNRTGFIIGSALAAYCPAVRGTDAALSAKLYIFPDRLNKFIDHVQGNLDVDLSSLPSSDITVSTVSGGQFTVSATLPAAGKAWAIVTDQTETSEQVEDEKGNVTTQTKITGGDVLIAQNMDFNEGDAFPVVYFTKKREIFDRSVWKDIR